MRPHKYHLLKGAIPVVDEDIVIVHAKIENYYLVKRSSPLTLSGRLAAVTVSRWSSGSGTGKASKTGVGTSGSSSPITSLIPGSFQGMTDRLTRGVAATASCLNLPHHLV